MRRQEHSVGRRAMEMKVQWRRKIERPKSEDGWTERGMISKRRDCRLMMCTTTDRATWRRMSSFIDPTLKWE